ncbi:MAG TPA: type II toxin-antitoxin system RelE/ParE family toxin [Candidatus Thermoplasmatota archaeon]
MCAFVVLFTSSAEREFRRLPNDVQSRFSDAFGLLEVDPRRRRAGCDVRMLSGVANAWRLRVGDYRGIYAVEGDDVVFTRFGHRRSIYG